MENKLKLLFDFQKFENNKKLAKLISETEARQAEQLSDEDLEDVAAAGMPEEMMHEWETFPSPSELKGSENKPSSENPYTKH